MTVVVQQLRTTSATALPASLEPGQLALNLANGWIMMGDGSNGVSAAGVGLAAGTATIFGVAGVVVPAAPGAGKGYEIYELKNPPATVRIFSGTGTALDAANGGTGTMTVRTTAYLVASTTPPANQINSATDLRSGDTIVVSSGTAGSPGGSYVWDGSSWLLTGGALPDATARGAGGASGTGGTKGVVYLARDTDVKPTGSAGATAPDGLAVATAAQVKALAELVAGLATGSTSLGTYDASAGGGQIASVTAAATGGTPARAGFTVAGKIGSGSNMVEGDYFLVTKAGTVTAETGPSATNLNVALNANDHIVYDGAKWHVVSSGVVAGAAFSVHSASDVSDGTVASVTPANQKGLLVRDNSIADGVAAAYKLTNTLDLGTFT
jgi:hypothetical protein